MTTGQTQNRVFRSYEQLERELMPKRAKELRAQRLGEDPRKEALEKPIRRSIVDIATIVDIAAEQHS